MHHAGPTPWDGARIVGCNRTSLQKPWLLDLDSFLAAMYVKVNDWWQAYGASHAVRRP
jgi:hypothetical protein